MAKLKFDGLEDWLVELEKLGDGYDTATGKGLYEGAKIVADDLRNAIESLPTDDKYIPQGEWGSVKRNGVRTIEKIGLAHGMGISKSRKSVDGKNISIGIHGYNLLGKPNVLVARSITSGTSFMKKNTALSKAIRNAKPKVEAKLVEVISKELTKGIK